ncbi:MAG TPA: hypothetical protein VFQ44_17665 [Streptosporangiaceae bacterium]|nr:hypothetical protein [Streptosporangiaceae bacterium]
MAIGRIHPGPFAEVISDFHAEMQEVRRLGEELKRITRDFASDDGRVPNTGSPKTLKNRRVIVVSAEPMSVQVRRLLDCSGFQFRADNVLVTFLARNLEFDVLEFRRITDFDPFLARGRTLSRDEIAAALDARRADRREPKDDS